MNEKSEGTIRIEVISQDGKTLLNFMLGFARFVGDQYTLKENGEIKRNTNYGSDKPGFGFKLLNDNSFELLRNGKALTYRHVDSLNTVINAKSIAGEYKDSSGKKYIFTEAGKAIFPDRSFNYSVATDFAPFEVYTGSHDELINNDINKDAKSNVEIMKNQSDYNYALEISDRELKLFKFDKNLPYFAPETIPFLVLQKVGSKP